jgi:hypothetical protein
MSEVVRDVARVKDELAMLRIAILDPAREADIRLVADFIVAHFPGFEDAIALGSGEPDGDDPATNAVYQAVQRILKRTS